MKEVFEAVRQTLAAYCHLLDRAIERGEAPEMGILFHPEAQLTTSHGDGKALHGHAAIAAWLAEIGRGKGASNRFVRHKLFEPYLVLRDNEVVASTYFDADQVDAKNRVRTLNGRYEDTLRPFQGRWLLYRRHIAIHYHALVGEAKRYQGRDGASPGEADGWEGVRGTQP